MTASAVSPETPTISVSHLRTRSATKAVTATVTASSLSFECSATAPTALSIIAVEIDFPACFDHDLDRALGSSPETEGVLGARRPLADCEEAGHRIQAIRYSQELPGHGFRHLALEAYRRVVIAYRGPKLLVSAFQPQIVAAHDALEFRELANHVGQKVRFGERRRGAQFIVASYRCRERRQMQPPDQPTRAALSAREPSTR